MDKATPQSEQLFQQLQQLVHEDSGTRLPDHRRVRVAARLAPRLRHHHLESFASYVDLLTQPAFAAERALAVDLVLSKETYFFREHRHFEFLAQWLERNPEAQRFWSAACASGEEAYSLAMVASEHAGNDDWSVLGSDFSERALRQMAEGVYDIAQARWFPEGWLQRHTLCGTGATAGRLRMQEVLRARVQGRRINLIEVLPADLPLFDAVFLRNLLMYLEGEAQQQVLRRVLGRLARGGLLVIGHTEPVAIHGLPLRPLMPSVYERL